MTPATSYSALPAAPILMAETLMAETVSGHEAVFDLMVPENLIYFSGHFHDQPILPGVTQVKWAEDFARRVFPVVEHATEVTQLKFLQVIRPGQRLELVICLVPSEAAPHTTTVRFSFRDKRCTFSSGVLRFK